MNKEKNKKEETLIIDATGRSLGRIASQTAMALMGKTRASFKRNEYSGIPVKVINTSKMRITVKKLDQIVHKRYSGMRGGLRILKGTEIVEKKGFKELLKHSIVKMLPDNKLRKEMVKKLTISE